MVPEEISLHVDASRGPLEVCTCLNNNTEQPKYAFRKNRLKFVSTSATTVEIFYPHFADREKIFLNIIILKVLW